MGALSFASPLLLVALAALPALWFILRATPPAPQRVRFPAFDILKRIKPAEEQPDRTPWPILLLRLLLAALAIIALAGPTYDVAPPKPARGPMLIVIDDSAAAAPDWENRRAALAAAAEDAAAGERDARLLRTASPLPETLDALSPEGLRAEASRLAPQANAPDYAAAARLVAALDLADADIRWHTDGLAHPGAIDLLRALAAKGAVTVYSPVDAPPALAAPRTPRDPWTALDADGAPSGDLVALARDGREVARAPVENGAATLDLPLALQNDVAQARLAGVASAAAVQLADARARRALVGIVSSSEAQGDPLLSGAHYIEKALEPYAAFLHDDIEALAASDASVIAIDDVGVIRASDEALLRAFMERGGVVIRFAGPNLAAATDAGAVALVPAPLRGGGRAFGGALTWETPQAIGAFADGSPFAALAAPPDVLVRRQVLAEPGGEASAKSWAFLADGTPLVTADAVGAGALVLFHVTATPEWSDLPLSALYVDMLRQLTMLSSLGPDMAEPDPAATFAAYRVLDGFGGLRQPSPTQAPARLADAAQGARPGLPAGLYGSPDAPLAVNVIVSDAPLKRLALPGVAPLPYQEAPARRLAGLFAALALALFALDCLVALAVAGRLRPAAIALAAVFALAAPDEARAQSAPLDAPISEAAREAALATRLAYIKTGDPDIDRVSAAGLENLSRALRQRTSVEPAEPAGVDPETDDLAVYQFLYWPIAEGAPTPSAAALANIENFMRFGGLVVFDTRDDERGADGAQTPARAALRDVLANVDMPPLAPPPADHVVYRSFYLLDDLYGRMALNPVFVQARGGANDAVTPVIIGGRDWAGAWAADSLGNPMLPMSQGGERTRELALRAGVNMVMVALTGNYKSDQVHAPILLERLRR